VNRTQNSEIKNKLGTCTNQDSLLTKKSTQSSSLTVTKSENNQKLENLPFYKGFSNINKNLDSKEHYNNRSSDVDKLKAYQEKNSKESIKVQENPEVTINESKDIFISSSKSRIKEVNKSTETNDQKKNESKGLFGTFRKYFKF